MNTQIKNFLNPKYILIATLLIFALYITVNNIIDNRLERVESEARINIANQKATLLAIAETTARNGADSVTESIVKDCSTEERSQFEDYLNRLNTGLINSELSELERLFGRCGSFYSDRKSVMVSRLAREIEVYEAYVAQLSVILDKDITDEYLVEKWNNLASAEKEQSELFAKLVQQQDKIISTLLAGKLQSSPEIIDILKEVKETQESLVYSNKQASTVRAELAAL